MVARGGWRRLSLSTLVAAFTRPLRAAGADVAAPTRHRPVPAPADTGVPVTLPGVPVTLPGVPVTHAGVPVTLPSVPVTLGGTLVRQTDQTTCGSTVLLMLAATGDPVLALWLERGELPADLPRHRIPPEIPPTLRPRFSAAATATTTTTAPGITTTAPVTTTAPATTTVPVTTAPAIITAASVTTVTERLSAAQQYIKVRTGARAVGLLRWPGRFGTPPWTAAREARFPSVAYRAVPLDDAAPAAAALLASVHRATTAGVPVPLYTGGDIGRGIATAIPRHVVLAVPPPASRPAPAVSDRAGPADSDRSAPAVSDRPGSGAGSRPGPGLSGKLLHLYDPASGKVYQVPLAELLHRTEPHPALGGWTHVAVVLLPTRVTSRECDLTWRDLV
ncbi:hypothetical protein [Georgenia sp.]